jgi:transcriptional regulator with XRE-family HTH domain
MQAKKITLDFDPYSGGMNTGRPAKRPRPPFGERLHALREAAGLSQQQLAERVGISQAAYAWWERRPVALRPDQIQKLATVLDVSADDLLGVQPKRAKPGPKTKLQAQIEQIQRLPRAKQQTISEVLDMAVKSATST